MTASDGGQMDEIREYHWRCFSGLYKSSWIRIDFSKQMIEFENSMRPNGFFNLFFQKSVVCPFNEVRSIRNYEMGGYDCLEVITPHRNCVYLSGEIKGFAALVFDFQSIAAIAQIPSQVL